MIQITMDIKIVSQNTLTIFFPSTKKNLKLKIFFFIMATLRRTSIIPITTAQMQTAPIYNSSSIMPPEPTSQNKVTMCFQYSYSGIFNSNQPIFSPPFSTHTDTFWQLKFAPVCVCSKL